MRSSPPPRSCDASPRTGRRPTSTRRGGGTSRRWTSRPSERPRSSTLTVSKPHSTTSPSASPHVAHACTHTTFAPTVMHGGTKTNVIPDRVDLQVDIRTLPGQSATDITAMLDDALGDLADRVTVLKASHDDSTASPIDTPLWDAMGRAAQIFYPDSRLVPTMTISRPRPTRASSGGSGSRPTASACSAPASLRGLRADVPRRRRARRRRVPPTFDGDVASPDPRDFLT